jgi:hypothetical protein
MYYCIFLHLTLDIEQNPFTFVCFHVTSFSFYTKLHQLDASILTVKSLNVLCCL